MRSFYDLMGVLSTGFDPEHRFVTSWILPPTFLAFLRILFSIYCFATIFASWGFDGTHGHTIAIGRSFSYFTELGYWGIAFYLLIAATHGFVYVKRGRSWLDGWPRPLQVLHSLLYTTVVVFPFIVTGVYWGLLRDPLYGKNTYTTWSNTSKHVMNSLTALLEIILPSTNPPPFLHIVFLVIILALYLALAYLTYATQGWYTYSFLDTQGGRKSGKAAAVILIILAAALVLFLIVWSVISLRRKLTGGKVKRPKRDVSSALPHAKTNVEMTTK